MTASWPTRSAMPRRPRSGPDEGGRMQRAPHILRSQTPDNGCAADNQRYQGGVLQVSPHATVPSFLNEPESAAASASR